MAVSQETTDNKTILPSVARFCCFLILATIGMATIGLALLAGPVNGFFRDCEQIRAQKERLAELENLHKLQDELLANVNNPSVVARAAVCNLNYVPVHTLDGTPQAQLTQAFPELEDALRRANQKPQPPQPPYAQYASILAQKPQQQTVLLALGSVLLIISLTFFNRPGRPQPAQA